jgi:hypothetical protein
MLTFGITISIQHQLLQRIIANLVDLKFLKPYSYTARSVILKAFTAMIKVKLSMRLHRKNE